MGGEKETSSRKSKWENATAGAVAGFATVAVMHPLDVVRTRFQVNDGRVANLPTYRNTVNAILTISRSESQGEERYSEMWTDKLSPGLHLASAAKAGALVSLCTNPIWLVKTRLQLQTPLHQQQVYSGLYDAFRTIMRKEELRGLYKGFVPGLFLQVSHDAIQFTAYEELRKLIVEYKSKERRSNIKDADIETLICKTSGLNDPYRAQDNL